MRYVLGATFNAVKPGALPPVDPFAPPVAPGLPAKLDPVVTIGDVDNVAWIVPVTIPAYDLATSNRLSEVRLYLAPVGSTLPVDGDGWVASSYPVQTVPTGHVQTGAAGVAVPLPDAPIGVPHLGQVVLGYEV